MTIIVFSCVCFAKGSALSSFVVDVKMHLIMFFFIASFKGENLVSKAGIDNVEDGEH